jgi:hypothetical protein
MTKPVSRRPVFAEDDFHPCAGHVGFMVDRVALGQIFPVSIIPPMFHFHPFIIGAI